MRFTNKLKVDDGATGKDVTPVKTRWRNSDKGGRSNHAQLRRPEPQSSDENANQAMTVTHDPTIEENRAILAVTETPHSPHDPSPLILNFSFLLSSPQAQAQNHDTPLSSIFSHNLLSPNPISLSMDTLCNGDTQFNYNNHGLPASEPLLIQSTLSSVPHISFSTVESLSIHPNQSALPHNTISENSSFQHLSSAPFNSSFQHLSSAPFNSSCLTLLQPSFNTTVFTFNASASLTPPPLLTPKSKSNPKIFQTPKPKVGDKRQASTPSFSTNTMSSKRRFVAPSTSRISGEPFKDLEAEMWQNRENESEKNESTILSSDNSSATGLSEKGFAVAGPIKPPPPQ
ncbi:hypothetical protein FRX31_014466 [Thalictrum thalictroides]|uniref:Uncharacterized protein n=2 Tax=Thalictrum thalictroides TaxID=46969 RepID=A0A7J6WGA5_THATH|nr:hypothetical protein FRX31_014466 [Thalictrum thalictroides]